MGKMSDVHHYKGTINAGIVRWIATNGGTGVISNASNAGVYILRLTDIPNYPELSNLYEFIRVNRCRLEFMPRYNMTNLPGPVLGGTGSTFTEGTQSATAGIAARLPTFITGLDEVPLVNAVANTDVQPSASWITQGGDSSAVNEMTAYQATGVIGADYIRGLKGSKETEVYKKHTVTFVPSFFDYTMTSQVTGGSNQPTPGQGTFEKKGKRWLNCTFISQSGGTASSVESLGPDFYGPVYSFSNPPATSTTATNIVEMYDVKLHYSISMRRYKGAPGLA